MGFKKDYEKYENLLQDYRPTIRSFLFDLFLKKFVEKNRHKEKLVDPEKSLNVKYLFPDNLVYIALIQDGTVKEMIRIDKQTAEILSSDLTEFVFFDNNSQTVKPGMKYKNGEFLEAKGGKDEKQKD